MVFDLVFDICQDSAGRAFSKFGKIIGILFGESLHVLITASVQCVLEGVLGNILDDLFLVDTVILLACQVNELEEKVVDVEVDGTARIFSGTHLGKETVDLGIDLLGVIVFDRCDDIIDGVLTKDDAVLAYLHFIFIKVYLFLVVETLDTVKSAA